MEDLKDLKSEVLELKDELGNNHGGTRSRISSWLAIIAIIFSLGTTAISAYNSHKEDIRENRREAREMIQRLKKLPIEQFELMEKYKDSGQGQSLSGLLIGENVLLATQAAELIDRYPDSFNSVEYFSVASALASSNINSKKVEEFYKKAVELATDANNYISTATALGQYHFSKGNVEEGSKYFELSLNAWQKFEESNEIFKRTLDIQTYISWSGALLFQNLPQEASGKIQLAREQLSNLPESMVKETLKLQVQQTENMIIKSP